MTRNYCIFLVLFITGCIRENDNATNEVVLPKKDTAIVETILPEVNKTTDTTFYPSGEIESITSYLSYPEHYKFTFYYPNGAIKFTGEQDNILGCGVQVGMEVSYDSSGVKIQERLFDTYLPHPDASGHELRTLITVINYRTNGSIISKEFIETCYECDSCPCGKWEFYNQEGELTEVKVFEDCEDNELSCLNE